jgi:peptidoglycan hydrolase CwlO-like protein
MDLRINTVHNEQLQQLLAKQAEIQAEITSLFTNVNDELQRLLAKQAEIQAQIASILPTSPDQSPPSMFNRKV